MSSLEKMYLVYLFGAYTAIWVIMFGFLYRMVIRAKIIEHDVRLLKEEWLGHRESTSASEPSVNPIVPGHTV